MAVVSARLPSKLKNGDRSPEGYSELLADGPSGSPEALDVEGPNSLRHCTSARTCCWKDNQELERRKRKAKKHEAQEGLGAHILGNNEDGAVSYFLHLWQ